MIKPNCIIKKNLSTYLKKKKFFFIVTSYAELDAKVVQLGRIKRIPFFGANF